MTHGHGPLGIRFNFVGICLHNFFFLGCEQSVSFQGPTETIISDAITRSSAQMM